MDGTKPSTEAPEPQFPGSQVLQLLELLKHWHIDASELLKDTGLTVSSLEEPNARIPLVLYNGLVSRARKLTGEPALGMHEQLECVRKRPVEVEDDEREAARDNPRLRARICAPAGTAT